MMNLILSSADRNGTWGAALNQGSTPPCARNDLIPASFAQQSFWLLDQLEPNNPAYNLSEVWRLNGTLNIEAFQQSLGMIIRRHEVLRSTFDVVGGQLVQTINPPYPMEFPLTDLGAYSKSDLKEHLERLIVEEVRKPFHLRKGPLLRARLFRLQEKEHIVVFSLHHVVFDAWSKAIFMKEMGLLYEAISRGEVPMLPKLAIQYSDFAKWQRDWLQGQVLEQQLSYWKEHLKGALPLMEMPLDHPRPSKFAFRGAVQTLLLPTSFVERIKSMSRSEGVTEFMVLLAVFQALLSRYSGNDDILVGSPSINRNREEFEPLIGCFLNTLVLRVDLSDDPSFRKLLKRVRDICFEAYAHQELPFEKLVEELQPLRNPSYHPIFQVMFTFQNAPLTAMRLTDLEMDSMDVDIGVSKFDLMFNLIKTPQGLSISAEYSTDLFEAATIERMMEHYRTLLEGVLSAPEQGLSTIPLISEKERSQLLVEWNQTHIDYPKRKCLHQLFEEQAEKTPGTIALCHGDRSLAYRELNRQANALASRLVAMGIGPEVPVGICLDRSVEMVVALLAVLKAGGAYVPLDPSYPSERILFAVEDTQMPLLLTQEKWIKGLASSKARLVDLNSLREDWKEPAMDSEQNFTGRARPENLAYIIYTSGSTGRPKGVAIEHRSSVTFAYWAQQIFTAEELAGVLASTSICFDLSVFELFVPLSCGGRVILAENVLELPRLPSASQVTLVNTVPSAMAELIRLKGVPPSVRTVNLAGEALPTTLVERIYELPHIQKVYDLYGPSEDTTYSTFALRTPAAPPTIGRPIANTQVYILDRHQQPVPIGVPGELCLGGEGLARGYLNQPNLTAEKFIPNRWSSATGARLYRTGDLARYRPDGTIQYLGRLDHQVKIRGFRIELGEIEAVLRQHPEVHDCAVLAYGRELGEKRLVAYVVPHATEALRQWLKGKLPAYMLPSAWISLPLLPRTPNGKLDRKSLPAPDLHDRESKTDFIPPGTSVEKALAQIWREVLGIEQIGLNDSFFDLGGHSLLATRVVSRVREVFQVDLSLRDFFEEPTLSAIALLLERLLAEEIKQLTEEEAFHLAHDASESRG